jgi:hypothetical protein
MTTGNVHGVSIRHLPIEGEQNHVSLCWQNLDPLEDRRATDSSVSNARLSNTGKRVEDRRVRARLLVWLRNMVASFSAPIPAGTGMQRIRTSTK